MRRSATSRHLSQHAAPYRWPRQVSKSTCGRHAQQLLAKLSILWTRSVSGGSCSSSLRTVSLRTGATGKPARALGSWMWQRRLACQFHGFPYVSFSPGSVTCGNGTSTRMRKVLVKEAAPHGRGMVRHGPNKLYHDVGWWRPALQ